MDNCLFCRIVNKEIPSRIVYGMTWFWDSMISASGTGSRAADSKNLASMNDVGRSMEIWLHI